MAHICQFEQQESYFFLWHLNALEKVIHIAITCFPIAALTLP